MYASAVILCDSILCGKHVSSLNYSTRIIAIRSPNHVIHPRRQATQSTPSTAEWCFCGWAKLQPLRGTSTSPSPGCTEVKAVGCDPFLSDPRWYIAQAVCCFGVCIRRLAQTEVSDSRSTRTTRCDSDLPRPSTSSIGSCKLHWYQFVRILLVPTCLDFKPVTARPFWQYLSSNFNMKVMTICPHLRL